MAFCTKCGAAVADDQQFCTACGAKLKEAAAPVAPAAPAETAPVEAAPAAPVTSEPAPAPAPAAAPSFDKAKMPEYWHKAMLYGITWLVVLFSVINGFKLITGPYKISAFGYSVTDEVSKAVYEESIILHLGDILFGLVFLALAAGCVLVWLGLFHYKKGATKLAFLGYVVVAGVPLVYLILNAIVLNIAVGGEMSAFGMTLSNGALGTMIFQIILAAAAAVGSKLLYKELEGKFVN